MNPTAPAPVKRARITLIAFATLALATIATAQNRVALFNGKNLEGWVSRGGAAKFHVEDGAIVGTSVLNTVNTFLCTEKNYGDFILELEFKGDEKLNSGVQIRSQCFPEPRETNFKNTNGKNRVIPANRVHGYQVEIDPDTSRSFWTGGIYDEAHRGWLYPVGGEQGTRLRQQGRKIFKPGDWNHLRVEAIGDSIKTWLNGHLCADLIDSATPSGFIGLQVHRVGEGREERAGSQIRFRNIYITEVDASTRPATKTPAPAPTPAKKKPKK